MRSLRAWVVLCLLSSTIGAATVAEEKVLQDNWYVVHLAGQRVGYLRSRVVQAGGAAAPIVTTETMRMTVAREQARVPVEMTLEQHEDAAGRLRSFAIATRASTMAILATGTVREQELELATYSAGSTTRRTLPWDPEVIGSWAQHRLIAANLAPGRQVEFKTFVPDLVTISKATVKVGNLEEVPLLRGIERLRRVTTTVEAMPQLTLTAWLDGQGRVVKSHIPLMGGVETHLATREEALREVEEFPDLVSQFVVRPNVVLPAPERVVEVLYRLSAPGERLKHQPPPDRRQTIVRREGDAVWVRVEVAPPPARPPAFDPSERQPGGAVENVAEEYRLPGPYIQSDDAEIVAVARQATAGARDQWEAAKRLESWVRDNIRVKDLSVGFASARETLQTRAGDCTEHAVTLAALCRAVGLPARVAVGLACWRGVFAYHMWTEVYVGEWAALDAALPGPFVSAARIKLSDSSLRTGSWGQSLVDLLPLIGQMKIEILAYRLHGEERVVVAPPAP